MMPSKSMIPVALLAGGLATRLHPMTETIPKALVQVAGTPFIVHQLRLLRREGIERVVLCAGYLGEMICEFVGNGSAFDLEVTYSFDGDKLLGTGGALRQALPLLGKTFFVLYGDSYLDIDYGEVLAAFNREHAPALMTVFRNEGQWDTSNVIFDGHRLVRYDKKELTRDMRYIDYGLGILTDLVLADRPVGAAFDLADVYSTLAAAGALAGFEVQRRFYEIGTRSGLAETDKYLRGNG